MIYNNFKGKSISALGFGTMRLPTVDGDNAKIDQAKVNEMFDYAIAHGVNYFDTAWGYHSGMSEISVGEALKRHGRDEFYLATKFPGYDVSNMGKAPEIFARQLEKCQVEYFDFYLVHNVCEANIEYYLDPKYKTVEYLLEEKKNGRIKHLGFSTHATFENFKRFLDMYGEVMEFCQIQLNYLDYEFQDAKAKIEYLRELNIPVWVMEPVRGGRLANLSESELNDLHKIRNDESAPALAFRFVQSIPEVTVTLSGMSNFEQVKENIETYKESKPFNADEMQKILSLGKKMTECVPCTSCRYCTEYCPQGLDIPKLIALYNEQVFSGGGFIVSMSLGSLPEDKRPSACIGCGACQAVCPQNIRIPEIFSDFVERRKK
ncbi:MAG: aldo/keto reductase [Clostridia bacterium]|nr:aldo/keto reductase [Clostridia bacterium]